MKLNIIIKQVFLLILFTSLHMTAMTSTDNTEATNQQTKGTSWEEESAGDEFPYIKFTRHDETDIETYDNEICSDLDMIIKNRSFRLLPHDPYYIHISNSFIQPSGCAIGKFTRKKNGIATEVRTIVYPDESYIEEEQIDAPKIGQIYRTEVYNIPFYDPSKKIIKFYRDAQNNIRTHRFKIASEEFDSRNPIVHIMERKNKEIEAITNQLQTGMDFSSSPFAENN